MRTILFVDDEPNILQGLQRMLRPMHREWSMAFAGSGEEALRLMEQEPFDIIVSDMRMPGMDGATLLSRVMERYPETIRLALSGQSDKETIFRSVGPTHQFLAKPCDAETLKRTVHRALALRALLGSEVLKRTVSQLGTLPVLPDLYSRLMRELQSPDTSLANVAQIIENDVAMTAKILQYVNSAFFGVRQHVSSTAQAVSLLGLEVIRSLVLMIGIFAQTDEERLPEGFSLDDFARHSLGVGAFAKAICRTMPCDEREIGNAFTAGMLHDAGMLVFAFQSPEKYEGVLKRVDKESVAIDDAETEVFGASHSGVGAYLLGLWGFRDPVVEAVAFHAAPERCVSTVFSPLTAVHVANVFANTMGQSNGKSAPTLDMHYLRACDLEQRVGEWEAVCRAQSEAAEP